jgi:hypothetical protein
MSAPRNTQGSRYLLLCLLLLSASSMAGAREVRLHGPNGDGGCPDTATPATAAAAPTKVATPTTTHADKIKPVITVRGGGDDNGVSHAPRWHSFLPGMFR